MYRNVILDFISNNRKTLIDNNYCQMTLVYLQFNISELGSLYKNDGNVMIYHIKEPYVFEKKYDISKLSGSIVEVAMGSTDSFTIKYNEITYEILDPYYLKDLRKLSFKSMTILPITQINNEKIDEVIGYAILYSNNENVNYNLTNSKFLQLKKKLENSFHDEIVDNIKNSIWEEENHLVVVYSKEQSTYYCNNNAKKAIHINDNYINNVNKSYLRVKKFVNLMNKLDNKEHTLYYLIPSKLSNLDDQSYYLLDSINQHQFIEEATLIYLKDNSYTNNIDNLTKIFCELINNILPEAVFKFYKIDEYSVAIMLNMVLNHNCIAEVNYKFKKIYHQIILLPKELSFGTNLISVIEYINEILPSKFNYLSYSKYLDNKNSKHFECDVLYFKNENILIKADSQKEIGQILIDPIKNYYISSAYDLFEKNCIATIEKSLNFEYSSPVYTILVESCKTKKVYELLKKVINKFPNAKLILHSPVINDVITQEIYEIINKLHNLGFTLIADSTIFMNLKLNVTMKWIDAIIIRKNECNESIYEQHLFNQNLFNTYYSEGKVLIFEDIPSENDIEMINELTCLFVPKENKDEN